MPSYSQIELEPTALWACSASHSAQCFVFCLYDDGNVCKSTASVLKLNALCDAAEHHRMQAAPGPADYKLLRDGAMAALQFLYLEMDALRRLKYTLETNRRSIERSCASAASSFLADVGELSCSCLQSILHSKQELESSDTLCLLHPCPTPAPLACCLLHRHRFHSHAHLPIHSVPQTHVC